VNARPLAAPAGEVVIAEAVAVGAVVSLGAVVVATTVVVAKTVVVGDESPPPPPGITVAIVVVVVTVVPVAVVAGTVVVVVDVVIAAPVKIAPLKIAPVNIVPVNVALVKSTADRLAPVKFVPVRFAPLRSVLRKSAYEKSIQLRFWFLRSTLTINAYLQVAPHVGRFALVVVDVADEVRKSLLSFTTTIHLTARFRTRHFPVRGRMSTPVVASTHAIARRPEVKRASLTEPVRQRCLSASIITRVRVSTHISGGVVLADQESLNSPSWAHLFFGAQRSTIVLDSTQTATRAGFEAGTLLTDLASDI